MSVYISADFFHHALHMSKIVMLTNLFVHRQIDHCEYTYFFFDFLYMNEFSCALSHCCAFHAM